MRRNATYLLATLTISLTFAIAGCKAPGDKPVERGLGPAVTDAYSLSSQESGFESESYPSYGAAAPVEMSYEPGPSVPTAVSTPRYHVVAKRDTLYALARAYYGNQARWKDIYEANRSTIGDPNMIRVGQRLLIPQ